MRSSVLIVAALVAIACLGIAQEDPSSYVSPVVDPSSSVPVVPSSSFVEPSSSESSPESSVEPSSLPSSEPVSSFSESALSESSAMESSISESSIYESSVSEESSVFESSVLESSIPESSVSESSVPESSVSESSVAPSPSPSPSPSPLPSSSVPVTPSSSSVKPQPEPSVVPSSSSSVPHKKGSLSGAAIFCLVFFLGIIPACGIVAFLLYHFRIWPFKRQPQIYATVCSFFQLTLEVIPVCISRPLCAVSGRGSSCREGWQRAAALRRVFASRISHPHVQHQCHTKEHGSTLSSFPSCHFFWFLLSHPLQNITTRAIFCGKGKVLDCAQDRTHFRCNRDD